MKRSLIIFTVLSLITFVKAQSRIVGGEIAPPVFGRFHASLQNLTGYHVCGGAVISKWHIVTAAHCLFGAEPEYIKVVVGTPDLTNGGIKHNVQSFLLYNGFNYSAKTNDIALIKVDIPFDLNRVSVIAMDESFLHEDDVVLLSGFGALQVNATTENSLRILTTRVFSQNTCIFAMRNIRLVTDSMFCTFTRKGQGTCNGDSGSPILRENKLVGLVSWGVPCAVGFPDVHTRIAPYVQWLKKQIRHDVCVIKWYNI